MLTDKTDEWKSRYFGNGCWVITVPPKYKERVAAAWRRAMKPRQEELDGYVTSTVTTPTGTASKPTNPKDVAAVTRVPLGNIPLPALTALSLALLEGELKYGRANWRESGVQASVYLDALNRHILKWIEGEERDPITKVKHLGNAMACLAILLDAQVNGKLYDDRRRDSPAAIAELTEEATTVAHLRKLFHDQQPTHYLHGNRTAGGPEPTAG